MLCDVVHGDASLDAVNVFIELILTGTDPSTLDMSTVNSTLLLQRLDQLAAEDSGLYGRFENALVNSISTVYDGNEVAVLQCPTGSYIDPATKVCTACRAGYYSVTVLSTSPSDCQPCLAGTYSLVVGANNASACQPCAAGTFSSVTGANSSAVCRTCGAASTSVVGAQGSEACVCVAGFYRDASSACVRCEEGYYCLGSVRSACPGFSEYKSISPAGSSTLQQCKCRPGYYSFASQGSGCLECPPNSYCTGEQDVGNYGKRFDCPANSQSDAKSVSLEDCRCLSSFRKQYSMASVRGLTVTASPCNCTNPKTAGTDAICKSLDALTCVGCTRGDNCDNVFKPTLTCKQGYIDVTGNVAASTTKTWIIAPAGAVKVRILVTKMSVGTMTVTQCVQASCSTTYAIGSSFSGPMGSAKSIETSDTFPVMRISWTTSSNTNSPLELEYTSEIGCDKTDIALRADFVQFSATMETQLYPFQPDLTWPLVIWFGDIVQFTGNSLKLDLRQGSSSGVSVLDPLLGLGQWIPESEGSYWLVDTEYRGRARQVYVAPVDPRKVQVWYTATTGASASFTLSGDVAGTGSPDVVLVVRDVLTMGRLTTAHGLVLMSSYANATAWTALGGAGVTGQSAGTPFETSVTWDSSGYDPGVYYYGSVSSMGSVKVGRIVLYPSSGGVSCAACLEGEYCYDGSVMRCPANARSPIGSDEVSDCKCSPGFTLSTADLQGYGNSQSVDSGGRHSCVVAQNGSLWCWGANEKGQLGIGVVGASRNVTMVPGLAYVRNVSLGDDFTCAVVGANSRVVCWGDNEYGQLGLDSSALTQASPGAEAMLGGGATAYQTQSLACAGQSCCAIVTKPGPVEALTCWGRGNFGQLGKGGNFLVKNVGTGRTFLSTNARYSYADTGDPVSLGTEVARSVTMAVQHACAVTISNTVYCWGLNGNGALGIGSAQTTSIFNPTQVNTGGPVKTVNCFAFVCCAVMAETFQVKCWGRGDQGRLGVGMFDVGVTPQSMGANLLSVNLGKDTLVMDVNVGETQVCALLLNNFVKCWGSVKGVTLGDNPPLDAMNLLPDLELADASVALQVGGKGSTMCAVLADYRVVCWGAGSSGQLGGPVVVPSLSLAVASLPAGVSALRSSGSPTQVTCMVCDANTYCVGNGGLAEQCPANTRSPVMSTNAGECVCLPGYKRAGATGPCVLCSGREYCAVGQAFECPLNSATLVAGSSELSACQCDKGYYYAGVNLGCSPCQGGEYKDAVGNAGSCQRCPAGTRSTALALGNASGCAPCDGGTFSGQGAQVCLTCGAGTAAARGSGVCSPCGAGFFAGSGAAACSPCAAGTFDVEPRDGQPGTCSACPNGTFSGVLNATTYVCQDCDAGKFSGSGASQCEPCGEGTYSPRGAVGCTPCPANSTSVAGSVYAACQCLAGTYKRVHADGQTFTCETCGAGEYAAFDAVGACRKCAAGTASAARGAASSATCSQCTKGSAAAEGSASCTPCTVGSFSAADGAGNCTDCRLGYWAASGASQCVGCGSGKYAMGKIGSSAQCLPCPAGGYCLGADNAYAQGKKLFEPCPLGTFQNVTGQSTSSQCQPCPANFFCPSPTLKGACPEGTESDASSVSQLQCECKSGFTCNYKKVLNAVVTLKMTFAEFDQNEDVKLAFKTAVAQAAGTTVDKVRITQIVNLLGGSGRRLLSARGRGFVHVAVEIEGGDGTGQGLGAELDARLGEVGLEIEEERGWIAPHEVTVRALV